MAKQKTVTGTISTLLGMKQDWRIPTYSSYIDGRGTEESKSLLREMATPKKISELDEHARILNEEIDKCQQGKVVNESKFRDAWNQSYFIVYGDSKITI